MRWIVRVARTIARQNLLFTERPCNHVGGNAYEEIKNRNGKMVNGTFVKEEDL